MKNNKEQHNHFNYKKSIKNKKRKVAGFARVDRVPGWPARSTEFRRANFPAGFYLNPDRSQARIDPPGRSGFQNYNSNLLQLHLKR